MFALYASKKLTKKLEKFFDNATALNRHGRGNKEFFLKETELAKKIIEHLTLNKWDVYQEVQPQNGGGIADIVGVCGRLVWVVECKTTLSLALLEQAMMWRGDANYISIAVPESKRHSRGESAAKVFLSKLGIGMFRVASYYKSPSQVVAPKLQRKRSDRIIKCLTDHHKTFAEAGNADGKRWTPFKNTCHELRRFITDHPGACLKDAMDNIKHHYSSDSTARASVSQLLRERPELIPGVRIDRDGKFLRLYPCE